MEKIKSTENDEIDLIDILKSIWDNKLKVILFVFISIVIGSVYIYTQPNLFKISFNIKESQNSEFTKFLPLHSSILEEKLLLVHSNKEKYLINSETMLKRFLNELMDYQELSLMDLIIEYY